MAGHESRRRGYEKKVVATDFNGKGSEGANQYGGNNKAGWLGLLPNSWLPFVQLARLSPPAGLFLIYFPHLFGLLHAASLRSSPPVEVFQMGSVLLLGSFFVSNAIHIWNDLIDAPLDAQVERTCQRPIPRGAVSSFAAVLFTATQAIGAAIVLHFLPSNWLQKVAYALPSVIAWTYYPWAKLHTNFPQIVLGICLGWGIFIASLAVGMHALGLGDGEQSASTRMSYSTLCLFAACVLWTMIFDTVYGFQDLEDDVKAGIGSMAVRYRDDGKRVLWVLLILMTALLTACGTLGGLGMLYFIVAVGGTIGSLGTMVAQVDLKSSGSCWWWFSNGFWYTGGFIASGLLLEYINRD